MNHAPLICIKAKDLIFGNFKSRQKMIFQIFLFNFLIFQAKIHSIPDIRKQKRGNTKKLNAQKSNSNKSNKLNSSFNISSIWKGLNWQCLSFIEWTLSFYVILQIRKTFLFSWKSHSTWFERFWLWLHYPVYELMEIVCLNIFCHLKYQINLPRYLILKLTWKVSETFMTQLLG